MGLEELPDGLPSTKGSLFSMPFLLVTALFAVAIIAGPLDWIISAVVIAPTPDNDQAWFPDSWPKIILLLVVGLFGPFVYSGIRFLVVWFLVILAGMFFKNLFKYLARPSSEKPRYRTRKPPK